MERWEYDFVIIEWDENSKVYDHNLQNLAPQAEIYAILDHMGANGWEMVNMWPQGLLANNIDYWGAGRVVTNWHASAKYAAVFKRKVTA